jgi:hypothetical protein
MESKTNVSSEQELLKLHEEGRISDDEYEELLGAIRRRPPGNSSVKPPAEPQFQAFRKRILVGGLIICILGVIFGVILDLPLVWGLGFLGIIIIPLKFRLNNKLRRYKKDS